MCLVEKSRFRDFPRLAKHFACDATDSKVVQAAIADACKWAGTEAVDCLLCNASAGRGNGSMLEITADELEQKWRIHVLTAHNAMQAALPGMLARKRGTILVTSATAAFRGSPTAGAFAVAMFSLRALAQSYAKEFAAKGIHVVHLRVDCAIDNDTIREKWPGARDDQLGDPTGMADTYWQLFNQNPRAWTNELDIRPLGETWTC